MENKIGNLENRQHNKLYIVICKCLYKGGVLPAEVDQCIEWAFGPGAWYVPPSPDWIDRWNKLHPKSFTMRRTDKLARTLQQVGYLFCAQKDKNYEMQVLRRKGSRQGT